MAPRPPPALVEPGNDGKNQSLTEERGVRRHLGRARTISSDPLGEPRRVVQSLLNRACPDNVSTIADKIAKTNVSNADELEVIIELMVRKALAGLHYCETYADLIFSLRYAFPEFPAEGGGKNITLESSILNVCQNEPEVILKMAHAGTEARWPTLKNFGHSLSRV